MTNTYKGIQYRLDDFQDMSEVDTAGYFGTNHQLMEKHTMTHVALHDFEVVVRAIVKDNQLVKIMHTIRSIDGDKNGFVTNQELEDILKLCYKEQLGKYNLKPVFKEFASQSNRLLIDYTKFKEAIVERLQKYTGLEMSPGSHTDRSVIGGAAGIKSIERNFTALDAIQGYDKYGIAREGQSDSKINLIKSGISS